MGICRIINSISLVFLALGALTAQAEIDALGLVREALPKGVKYRDPKSGLSVELEFSETGLLQEIREHGPGGGLRKRQTWSPGRSVAEDFFPKHWRRESVPAPVAEGCSPLDVTMADVPEYLKQLPKLGFSAGEATGDEVAIGSNSVSVNCSEYAQGASNGKAGAHGLAEDLTEGLKKGLDCMANDLGAVHPEYRLAAARILSMLDSKRAKPIRWVCASADQEIQSHGGKIKLIPGSQASASPPGHEAYPTIVVDLATTKKPGSRIHTTGMHEMLHLAGYDHGDGVDLPYLVASCCEYAPQEIKDAACKILKAKDLDWRSEEYQRDFAKLSGIMTGFLDTSFVSALNASWAGPDQGLIMVSLEIVAPKMTESPKVFDRTKQPWMALALDRAAFQYLPQTERKRFSSQDQKLAEAFFSGKRLGDASRLRLARATGDLLGAVMDRRKDSEISDKVDRFVRAAVVDCKYLNDSEKDGLNIIRNWVKDQVPIQFQDLMWASCT